MEKKSTSVPNNNPKGAQTTSPKETAQKFEPGKQSQVKTIGDTEFDRAIDLFVGEMAI